MQQMALQLPYPQGWCDANKFNFDAWPQYIKDAQGKQWLVLHVGGSPYAHRKPATFCCHKPRTVEYHHIKDTEAFPA